jgi:pilus assembly protein CpaE
LPEFDLQSLLIAPDRTLAEQFLQTVATLRAFQIVADLKSYPAVHSLDVRLRQYDPDVVLLDVASDPVAAAKLIERILESRPGTQIVALHTRNDKDAVVAALRQGASEFLSSPFELRGQQEAVSRIRRLHRPKASPPERDPGRLICIASAKPGSGASTIALEMALALENQTGGRVLLADGDAAGGTLGAPLVEDDTPSLNALLRGEADANWHRRTLKAGPVELLPAPRDPQPNVADPVRFSEAIEPVRRIYDWIIIDLPVAYERLSLISLPSADVFFLVSTPELGSLHLTRRALGLIETLGFPKSSARILVNRMPKRDGLTQSDLQRVFSSPVEAILPNDEGALEGRLHSLAEGGPLGAASDFGRGLQALAARVRSSVRSEGQRSSLAPMSR